MHEALKFIKELNLMKYQPKMKWKMGVSAVLAFINGLLNAIVLGSIIQAITSKKLTSFLVVVLILVLSHLLVDYIRLSLEQDYIAIEEEPLLAIKLAILQQPFERVVKYQWIKKFSKIENSLIYTGGLKAFYRLYFSMISSIIGMVLSIIVFCAFLMRSFSDVQITGAVLGGNGLLIALSVGMAYFVIYFVRRKESQNQQKQSEQFKLIMNDEHKLRYYLFSVINAYEKNKVIKLYDMAQHLISKYKKDIELLNQHNHVFLSLQFNHQLITELLGLVIFLWIVGALLVSSSMGWMHAMTSFIFIGNIFSFSNSLTNGHRLNKELKLSVERIQNIVVLKNEIKAVAQNKIVEQNEVYMFDTIKIEFCDVSFSYGDATSPVFESLNLELDFGKYSNIALVGMNGAGKSTLLGLILKFLVPTKGQIKLNGVDIQTIDDASYYKALSMQAQYFNLFHYTIGEAIAGNENYDEEKVWQVLEQVNLASKVRSYENQLQTYIENDVQAGIQLSGGEKQKIAIARTLYQAPRLLIFDEPTSAMDPISEAKTFQLFEQISHRVPVLFVTHKVSACVHCDHICVMAKGKAVGRGTHGELMRTNSIYREMFENQERTD